MPDNIDVQPDGLYDSDTGTPILTRETTQRDRTEWTNAHPPIPGLQWIISYDVNGQVRDRRLEVIPGWEDAFAPAVEHAPARAGRTGFSVPDSEANRLGALAYHGWFHALPEVVQASGTGWGQLADQFRAPMRAAAILVWQHAENAGFHEALLRTLPSAQLGAAGEIENLADLLSGLAKLDSSGTLTLSHVLAEMSARVRQLRRDSAKGAERARKTKPAP